MRDDDRPCRGMTYTSSLVEFLKDWEKCSLSPYWDEMGGCWTIAYGITGPEVDLLAEMNESITQPEADAWLMEKLDGTAEDVIETLRVPLEQQHFDALISFVHNIGIGAFRKSTMLKFINRADFERAAQQFPLWVHAGGARVRGLERRRIAELAIWKHGDYTMRP